MSGTGSLTNMSSTAPPVLDDSDEFGNSTDEDYEYDLDFSVSPHIWNELIVTTIIYTLVLVIGLVGNLLIIVTVARFRRMKSVTNIFLASLSSADLLVILICVPLKLAKLFSFSWTFGAFLCKLIHYMQMFSATCSVLTLTVLSLERFYAIVHPLRAKSLCTTSHSRKVIIAIWTASLVLAAPTWYVQVLKTAGEKIPAFWCTRDFENVLGWRMYAIYNLIILLIIPSYIMAFAYTKIGMEIWSVAERRATMINNYEQVPRSNEARGKPSGEDRQDGDPREGSRFRLKVTYSQRSRNSLDARNVKQLIKMLLTVVILFVVCWTPNLIDELLTAFDVLPLVREPGIFRYMYTTFQLLAYINSCTNPIVYGFMSRNFRSSMADALRCSKRNPQQMQTLQRQPTVSVRFTESQGSSSRTTSVSFGNI